MDEDDQDIRDPLDGMRGHDDLMHGRSASPSDEYGRHMNSSSFKPPSRFQASSEYGSGNNESFEDDGDLDGHGLGRKMMQRNHNIPPGQEENENEYGRSRFGNGNDRGPDNEEDGFGSGRGGENEGFNWNASEPPGEYGSSGGFGRGMGFGRGAPPNARGFRGRGFGTKHMRVCAKF